MPLYVPPGTAGLTPALSLEYNNRGSNGPMGPGWTIGGLSAVTRCKKATEYGDGVGPFPSINFDGVAADQAYCLDGARLLDLSLSPGGCPAGVSGDTAHEFGLELDPSTRVCGYVNASITGYAYWLAQPKDGSYRVYGAGGNSALVRNDVFGATTDATQVFSWGLRRIADSTLNTIEFSYNQTALTGEMDIAQIAYTGKIALADVLKPVPTFLTGRSPFANVTFSYTTLPAASQRVDYVADMALALTQQLTTITVQGPQNHGTSPDTLQTVRTYHLAYGVPTNSGLSALSTLQECAPNGTGEACYPATQFSWNFARNAKGWPTPPSTSPTYNHGLSYSIDYKVGDVDGDGRQDLVWVKDQSCDSTGSGDKRFQLFVSLGNAAGFAAPVATGVYISRPPLIGQGALPTCGADWRVFHFDSLWYLYDFSGDGRDDLLAANGTAWNGTYWTDMTWKIYPAIASGTGGAYTFDQANPIATGMAAWQSDDGLFLDENGDGVPDLMDSTTQYIITSHLLQKQSTGTLTYNFASTATPVLFTTPMFGGSTSTQELGFSTGAGRDVLNADLNGDGASDMVLKVIQDTCGTNAPAAPGGRTSQGTTYYFRPSSITSPTTICHERWYTFRNDGIQAGNLQMTYETSIGDTAIVPSDGSFINLVDINGDGQADLVYPTVDTGGNYVYKYRLNIGKANDKTADSTAARFAAEQTVGLTLSPTDAGRVQFADVNGDHRLDLLYQAKDTSTNTYPLKALIWGASSATGFAAAIDVGNSSIAGQDPSTARSFLIDVDGNGGPDFVSFVPSSSALSVYGYGPTFGGNDFLTTITNGLGALTGLNYYPLAYASAYKRAYDGPSLNWGRGSPVFDVFSSIWVVHSAASSAPTASDQFASSKVVYRYSGAKIQAGGRGFLGFKTVQAENQQQTQETKFLVTTTEYRQDFPYIGRPDETVVELETARQPDPCNAGGGDTCFQHDPPPCGSGGSRCNAPLLAPTIGVGGQLLSNASDDYSSAPPFSPGTVQPVMPYLSGSDEQKFDVTTSGTLSHEITSSFTQDKYGNVSSSSVVSSESSGIDETKTTTNIYGCTVAPPTKNCTTLNTEQQRLGRLSVSTVTSARGGQSNLRRASFEYDATTLLRIAEIQGPYDSSDESDPNVLKTLGLRTDLIRDSNGNVIQQIQCSTSDFANRTACTSLSGFQQRQWGATPTKIQRYANWDYDAKGRFELDKKVPFYSSTATAGTLGYAEQVGSTSGGTLNRDAFGNPLMSVSANGNTASFVYGTLGRAYFTEDSTGAFARTTYARCKDAGGTLSCPLGAIYRVVVDSAASGTYAGKNAAPTTWAYYDVLGREMLRTKRIYQQDPTSKMHWSSASTTYDSTGRVVTTSTPYFSIDPTTTQTTSDSTRAGAVQTGAIVPGTASTTYDAVDRATDQSHPEELANRPSDSTWNYATLTTTGTNPRGYQTAQTKNARDEVVSVSAPMGQSNKLTVNYGRDAVGNLASIQRTPNDGDSAGILITTSMLYDRLGRKTSLTDPDKGGWTYTYNALGELTTQKDAKGQTQTLYHDALGRLYQRNENRASGGNFVSEPTSTWEFDTASHGLGLLHINSNGIGGFSRTTSYDSIGRVSTVVTNTDSYSYTESQTYDQFGRAFQHFDPSTTPGSTSGELTIYSDDGYPIKTQEASDSVGGAIYDQVMALSQRGQVTMEEFHQNAALTTTRTYDDTTGRMLNINTDNNALQNWSYEYDKHSNVMHRYNLATGYNLKEDFTYDNLDRLKSVTLTNNGTVQPVVNVGYDQIGNLKSKSGGVIQSWTYGSQPAACSQKAGPHAASVMGTFTFCYDANGNQTTANYGSGQTRTIAYTGYDLAAQITTNGYPSTATESFAYAPDRSMFKRVEGGSNGAPTDRIFCDGFETTHCPMPIVAPTTYYVGNVETRVSGGATTTKRYIGGYLVITTTGAGNPTYAYLFRDALGSIDVITNEAAMLPPQQRQSFDAWGNRRDASAGGGWGVFGPGVAASFDTTRTYQGFTGHQQLDPVGLIHMKGRLYDPMLGRFIQADPMTEADATQGLNRYSYVLNNPLSMTDPSGYLSFRQVLGIAIAVVAAYFGQEWLSQGAYAWAFGAAVGGGFLSAYVATGNLKAGLWGAFAGGVFFGIGAGFSQLYQGAGAGFAGSGYSTGAFAANVAAHGAAGGVVSELQGGNFGNGFLAAGVTQALSPAIENIGNAPGQVIAAAVVGGTVSKITGQSFGNGALTAAFSQAFGEIANGMRNRAMAAAAYGDPDYYTADVMVDVGGQREDGWNIFGHVSIATTDSGMYSFGTGTAAGYSVTDFVTSQAGARDQMLYMFQTTPEQDAAIQSYMAPYAGHMDDVGYIDNCAARTYGALNAAGINPFMTSTSQPSFMIPALLGYGLQNAGVQGYYIPQHGTVPDLSQYNHH